MAEIKIKEGSCVVWHAGNPGKMINDKGHHAGTAIRIKFVDSGMKYTFVNGVLQGQAVQEAAEQFDWAALRKVTLQTLAQGLIILWALSIVVFWVLAGWNRLGQGLPDVPTGLATVIAAVIGVAGWQSFVTRKYK